MKKEIKRILVVFFILSFLIPLVSSATVVVNPAPVEKKPSFFDTYFGFLGSPIFWYVLVIVILLTIFLVGIFFLVRWLVKFLKSKNDIFYTLRKDRIRLAKIQSKYPSKHWYKIEKNTPIRLVTKDTGRVVVSEPIGYHRGDYQSHEGNQIISMNLKGNKKWFFFPVTDLLIIPNKESVNIITKDKKTGTEKTETITNLPQSRDIVQFNQGEILLYAESLSNVGIYYVPVLKAKDGKIIDLSLPVYQSLKEVVVGNYLYDQTSSFVGVAKKTMDLNPNLRFEMKSKDANTNVEVPQGNNNAR